MELVCYNIIFGMFPFAGYSNAMQEEQFNLEKKFYHSKSTTKRKKLNYELQIGNHAFIAFHRLSFKKGWSGKKSFVTYI